MSMDEQHQENIRAMNLWVQVLVLAVRDLGTRGKGGMFLRENTRLWFESTAAGPGTIEWICREALGIDPDRVRHLALNGKRSKDE